MVDTWRWPNASYSAPSMVPIDTPSRDAVARSITMFWRRPPSSTSLPTSCSLGFFFSSATSFGSHSCSSARSLPCRPIWYCAPWLVPPPPALGRSCSGRRRRLRSGYFAALAVSRASTAKVSSLRPSARVFRSMLNEPLAPCRLLPSRVPTVATSGSDMSIWVSRCMRCSLWPNETVALEVARPQIRPVSCAGNRPLLTIPNRKKVATISTSGVSANASAWRSENASARL